MHGAVALAASLALLAAVSAAEPPAAVIEAEATRITAIAKARPAVVAVFDPGGEGGGSGVVISADGYALTNYHVTQPCGHYMKCGLPDGRLYDAVLVGFDPVGDVALIKLFGRDDFPAATLGDSDRLEVGDWVFAMGNPFGLANDLQPTVTEGIISGTHRYQYPSGTLLEYADCLQTDASINPGNSGGPLFNAQSELVGINGRGSFEKRGRVAVNAGYAISINQIKHFLGGLRGGRILDHATLGATVAFDDQGRVVVNDMLDSSDAFRRGLRYGDEIVRFAGRLIETPNAFKNVLGTYPKDWRVPLSYRRQGKRYDVLVRLTGMHGEAELLAKLEAGPKSPDPAPEPDEKAPRPGQPKKKRSGRPTPDPMQPEVPKLKMVEAAPAIVARHYQERRGFANYYFNRLNRDRVMSAWSARFKPTGDGPWVLTAEVPGGASVKFTLAQAGARLDTPGSPWQWQAGMKPDMALDPPASGGLLWALSAWRALASDEGKTLTDLQYEGTAPLPGAQDLVDVLATSFDGGRCRFYFHPIEGHLLAMEMAPADDADPCEIYFHDYREASGRWLPSTMEVRYGDDLFGTFKLTKFDLPPVAKAPPDAKAVPAPTKDQPSPAAKKESK